MSSTLENKAQIRAQEYAENRRALRELITELAVRTQKDGQARVTNARVPAKEICLAHIIGTSDRSIYKNLALDIGFHVGEDHTGESIGIMRISPHAAVVITADIAVKAADVEIGFMDRFSGALIITGERAEVQTAIEENVHYFHDELGYPSAPITSR